MLQHLTTENRKDACDEININKRNYQEELPLPLVIKPVPYPQVQKRLDYF